MTTEQFKSYVKDTLTTEGWELITEFFISFARFECALKEGGFTNGGANRVVPNWGRFVSNIRSKYYLSKSQQINDAVNYITGKPPKIQILIGGSLTRRNRIFSSGDDEITKLKLSICDIRNNLFHGGKFQGIYEEDVSRNYMPLKHSITILNYWLTLNTTVNQNFSEHIF
jgi:hypothetical protein